MAGFKVKIRVTRLGVAVSQAEAVFGHLGVFTGSEGGEVEIEVDSLEEELTLILPIKITDPSDGKAIVVMPELTGDEELAIEMTTHGRYLEPGGYAPPE